MKKFLLSLAAVAVTGMPTLAKTITITPETLKAVNSSTKYVTTPFEFTVEGVTFTVNQVTPSTGQVKVNATNASGFSLYNNTAIEGLSKITYTFDNSTMGTWHTATGNEVISTNATTSDIAATKSSDSKSISFDITSGAFFHSNLTTKGSSTVKFTKIEIEIEENTSLTNPDLSFSESELSVSGLDAVFTAPTLSNEYNVAVTYGSSNEGVATVDENGNITLTGFGTTVISADSEANDEYRAGHAEYTLTVTDPNFKGYTLVTSLNELGNTAEVLIVNTQAGKAMGSQNKNNRAAVDVKVVANTIADIKGAQIVTLTKNAEGNYSFKVGEDGYLYASSSSSNWLQTSANEVYATVEIAESGDATIKFLGSYTHNDLRYNSQNSLFSCYDASNTSQPAVQLYMLQKAAEIPDERPEAPISFDTEKETVYLLETNKFELPTLNNEENLPVTWSSSNSTVAIFDVEKGNLAITDYGTTTISATYAATEEGAYKTTTASFDLNVICGIRSLAQFSADYGVNVEFGFPMTVTYKNGKNTYVVDEAGNAGLIYGETPYETLDIIPAGLTATATVYKELLEAVPVNTPAAEGKGVFTPAEITLDEVSADLISHRVVIKNVNFTETPAAKMDVTVDGVKFFNSFSIDQVEAGLYDVDAIITTFNGVQVYPIAYTPVVEEVEKKDLTLVIEGETYVEEYAENIEFTVALPEDANLELLEWTSKDENVEIITVNGVGLADTYEPGEYTLTVTYPGDDTYNEATASVTLRVYPDTSDIFAFEIEGGTIANNCSHLVIKGGEIFFRLPKEPGDINVHYYVQPTGVANTYANIPATHTLYDHAAGIKLSAGSGYVSLIAEKNGVEAPETVLAYEELTTGIAGIAADSNAPAVIYDLNGRQVKGQPAAGIYVVRQGNKTYKVVVK